MKPIIFSLPGNETLANCLIRQLHAEKGILTIGRFPDQETCLSIHSDVEGRQVIFIATLARPDDQLLPIYFSTRLLKDMGATCTYLVAPYLAYMRQDIKHNPGEAGTSAYFATLVSQFADRLITVAPHLHSKSSLAELYSIPTHVLPAAELIWNWIRDEMILPVIVGPDSQSEQWVKEIAIAANAPYLILGKTREGDQAVTVSVPKVDFYQDHTPVLVDGIISTARTMIETISHLKEAGMNPPVCIGVHGIFSDDAYQDLISAGAAKVITTNTIQHCSNQINISTLLSSAIRKALVLPSV